MSNSEHTHPCVAHCGRPADGYLMCRWCADELGHHLQHVPALTRELNIAISRRARFSHSVPVATSGPEPLPYDPGASDASATLHNTLSTWARDVAEHLGHDLDAGSDAELSRWLRARCHAIRTHPAAGELADEITHAISNGWRVVDRSPGRVYIGPCGADGCTLDLYGRADPSQPGRLDPRQAVVQCPCGTQWDAARRRAWLFDQLHESLATAKEIASAVGMIGERSINVKTIRSWHHNGRIPARGHTSNGVPLHRIGDVVYLAATTATRRRGVGHAAGSYA